MDAEIACWCHKIWNNSVYLLVKTWKYRNSICFVPWFWQNVYVSWFHHAFDSDSISMKLKSHRSRRWWILTSPKSNKIILLANYVYLGNIWIMIRIIWNVKIVEILTVRLSLTLLLGTMLIQHRYWRDN